MKIECSFFFNCSSKNDEKSRHFYFLPLLVILQISFMPAEPMAVARYSSPVLQLMPPNTQSFGSFNNSPTMPNIQSSIQREYSLKRNESPRILPFSVLVPFWAKHKLTLDQRGRIKNYKGIIKKFTRQIKRSPNINPSEEDDDLLKIKEISRLLPLQLQPYRTFGPMTMLGRPLSNDLVPDGVQLSDPTSSKPISDVNLDQKPAQIYDANDQKDKENGPISKELYYELFH